MPTMKKASFVMVISMGIAYLYGLTAGPLLLTTATAVAADIKDAAPAKPKLSPQIVKPLKATQVALNGKDWDEALVQLRAAQAVEPKTSYDSFMVDELGWYIHLQKKDYLQAAAALERIIESPYIADVDRPQRLRALTKLELQNKQYDKALQHGAKYMQVNPSDTEIALSIAQAHYLLGDFRSAKTAAEQIVASTPTPPENALLLALRANHELKDDAGTIKALEGLVKNYPQPRYQEDLLTLQKVAATTARKADGTSRSISSSACAQDLTHLKSRLVSEMRNDPQFMSALGQSLDSAVEKAGGVDRAIVLTRLQLDSNNETLQGAQACERESRADAPPGDPLDDTGDNMHGSCAKTIKVMRDSIMLNTAALEAFECRKR